LERLTRKFGNVCKEKHIGRRRCKPSPKDIVSGNFKSRRCTKQDVGQRVCRRRRRRDRRPRKGYRPKKRKTDGPRLPEDVEDCVSCRYVWLQVEMDVGNSQVEENIYDSFYQNALEAQKAPVFYPACQTMFDSIDDMIGDYMDGYTVNQICENSLLCR
jgi:hypothetical protein